MVAAAATAATTLILGGAWLWWYTLLSRHPTTEAVHQFQFALLLAVTAAVLCRPAPRTVGYPLAIAVAATGAALFGEYRPGLFIALAGVTATVLTLASVTSRDGTHDTGYVAAGLAACTIAGLLLL